MTDEDLLRSRGLRVTRPRVATLGSLRTEGHLTAESVRSRIGEHGGQVSVQAVYDVLTALANVGLVRRIEPAGSPARFELRTDNHHHLVCRGCGAIEDVDCVLGTAPCLEPDNPRGFVVDEAEITFWGLCSGCRQQSDGLLGTVQDVNTEDIDTEKTDTAGKGQP